MLNKTNWFARQRGELLRLVFFFYFYNSFISSIFIEVIVLRPFDTFIWRRQQQLEICRSETTRTTITDNKRHPEHVYTVVVIMIVIVCVLFFLIFDYYYFLLDIINRTLLGTIAKDSRQSTDQLKSYDQQTERPKVRQTYNKPTKSTTSNDYCKLAIRFFLDVVNVNFNIDVWIGIAFTIYWCYKP